MTGVRSAATATGKCRVSPPRRGYGRQRTTPPRPCKAFRALHTESVQVRAGFVVDAAEASREERLGLDGARAADLASEDSRTVALAQLGTVRWRYVVPRPWIRSG